ncbi:MAG: DUF4129 domain-containing protein [Tannerella sp.]|jgi:hypothetical protein|nr:DUF4129 domain-containing protein [Tannerella sp.]
MNLTADTIVYDIKKIAEYQSDRNYDYNSQLETPDYSIWEMLMSWVEGLLRNIFGGKFAEKYTSPILIVVFILVVATIIYFLYLKRPELFIRKKKVQPVGYNIEDEDIHEIDFDTEIAKATDAGDYRLAIRLMYLKTLRILSENKLIDWQIYKTPSEYLYEIKGIELKKPFKELTNKFLQVRYGNYDVSEELFEKILALHEEVKGGMDER